MWKKYILIISSDTLQLSVVRWLSGEISSGLARERDTLRTQTYGNRESTERLNSELWPLTAGDDEDGKSFGHPSPLSARHARRVYGQQTEPERAGGLGLFTNTNCR